MNVNRKFRVLGLWQSSCSTLLMFRTASYLPPINGFFLSFLLLLAPSSPLDPPPQSPISPSPNRYPPHQIPSYIDGERIKFSPLQQQQPQPDAGVVDDRPAQLHSDAGPVDDRLPQLQLSDGPIDDRPLQLVRPGRAHDRLELSEIVLQMLATVEEPVAFVAAVGPYHGGKSFLLNVLLNSSRGFSVGTKPEPETRGMWVRLVPKDRLTGVDGSRVILLDTEGFYGEGATRLNDARIFAVATLLSSHLVYNTIRTLGDAHSVSALADLAKQAQVFNLQNWLHTSDAKIDWLSLSMDVDPWLLLKTLDFPPLTWVVQGFDIDMQPLQTPLDYLKRYLLAHAHTGDRTLDTLFTKGISCYTLRTPADLNLLREQYGGQGLAADKELYNTLHQGYLSDIDKLRVGVFGNLTAKGDGKFTGKTIAALLPLLIHYVNEDFPLHADRKLRDVLVDIIVDGAFAGGVEYFQQSMQEALTKVGAERRKKEEGGVEYMEAMSSLAASALTSEQLESVMASAEHLAIEYCKRRCVGVAQGMVAISCQGRLGAKINNMKPLFREENERRVRDVLIRLGEGLRSAVEKGVLELKLPVPENNIKHLCSQAIKDALQRYQTLVGPHQGSHLYREACARTQEEIQAKCDKVAHMNMEKISSNFNAAKRWFQSSYEHAFLARIYGSEDFSDRNNDLFSTIEDSLEKEDARPVAQKKLNEIHLSSLKAAQDAFEKGVKNSGLLWMVPGTELYDFHHFQCLQWSKKRYTEIQALNNKLIMDFCEKIASALTLRYKAEVSLITPFPDNDETISAKADDIGKQLMQEYLSMTSEYASSSTVEERRKGLLWSIQDICAHLLKKNTALMAAFCYDPLTDAYKELQMQDCERTFHNILVSRSFWSWKCIWPGPRYTFGFKYAAYAAAHRHLNLAQASANQNLKSSASNHEIAKGMVLSPATRNKVIQAWIKHDLAHHANLVLVNFSIVSACAVVGVTFLVWVTRRLVCSLKGDTHIKKDMTDRWPYYEDQAHFNHEYRSIYENKPGFHRRHQ